MTVSKFEGRERKSTRALNFPALVDVHVFYYNLVPLRLRPKTSQSLENLKDDALTHFICFSKSSYPFFTWVDPILKEKWYGPWRTWYVYLSRAVARR